MMIVALALAGACGSSEPPSNKAACMKAAEAQPMVQPVADAINRSDAPGTTSAASALGTTLMAAQKLVLAQTTVQHDLDDALTQLDLVETDVAAAPPNFTDAQTAEMSLQTQMDQLSVDCSLVLNP
jgi:hypothetical protein